MRIAHDRDIIQQCDASEHEDNDDVENKEFPIFLQRRRAIRKSDCAGRGHRLILKSSAGYPAVARLQRNWLSIIYCHDVANTLINSEWKWGLLALCMSFLLTWLVFACVWMMISANNGDLDNDDDGGNLNVSSSKTVCLSGIQSFAGYLLFSIETQSTIGYGNRHITHHCPEAIFLLCLQLMVGSCVCGLLIQCMYEKLHGPKKLPPMVCFSEHALICQRDGGFCLVFRVRDGNGRYQCHNQISAFLIQHKPQKNNEILLKSITLERTGFLIWPLEVVHRINERSPLWDLSARDLITKRFEIIVSMEGTSLSTSSTSSTTTSYLNREILWGRRFNSCVRFDKASEMYIVDDDLFNSTRETEMPLCSARRLQQVFAEMTCHSSAGSIITALNSSSANSPQLSNNDSQISHRSNASAAITDSGICSGNVSPVEVHHVPSSPSPSCELSAGIDKKESFQQLRKDGEEEDKNGSVRRLLLAGERRRLVNKCNSFQENTHNEDTMDSLLVSLQKFLKEDNKVKLYDNIPSYDETSL